MAWEIKFSKTEHLFMTRKSWETLGGLLGVCISLKEAYLNEITFHAPCDVVKKNLEILFRDLILFLD